VHRDFIINLYLCLSAIVYYLSPVFGVGGIIRSPSLLGSFSWHHHQNSSSLLLMATCRAHRAQHRQCVSPSIVHHLLRFFLHYMGVMRYIIIHLFNHSSRLCDASQLTSSTLKKAPSASISSSSPACSSSSSSSKSSSRLGMAPVAGGRGGP